MPLINLQTKQTMSDIQLSNAVLAKSLYCTTPKNSWCYYYRPI